MPRWGRLDPVLTEATQIPQEFMKARQSCLLRHDAQGGNNTEAFTVWREREKMMIFGRGFREAVAQDTTTASFVC